MNPIYILKVMGEMGMRYRESKIYEILDYTMRMLDNGRVIIVYNNDIPYAVMFFSVTNNTEEFLKKDDWTYKSHDPEGNAIVVEKLIARGWNRQIRLEFESEIIKKFPNIQYGVWNKWVKQGDHTVKSRRRLQNVSN